MSRNNNYTTGNLLDYLYHQQSFKLIGTDKQIRVPQQIDFDGAKMIFIAEKQQKAFLNFSLDSLFLTE